MPTVATPAVLPDGSLSAATPKRGGGLVWHIMALIGFLLVNPVFGLLIGFGFASLVESSNESFDGAAAEPGSLEPAPDGVVGAPEPGACLPDQARAAAEEQAIAFIDSRDAAANGAPRDGWLDRLAPTDPALATAEAQRLDVIASLPIVEFDIRLSPGTLLPLGGDPCSADGRWQVTAETTVEFVDGLDLRFTEQVSVEADDAGWVVTAWEDGPESAFGGIVTPWNLGPVVTTVSERGVIFAWYDPAGVGRSEAAARELARVSAERTDRGSVVVDDFLGQDWPRSTLVYLPATSEQYDALVPGPPDEALFAGVAADYDTPDGIRDVVIFNPEGAEEIDEEIWEVTYAHELTHVAAGHLYGDGQQLWLAEGYAEHVGWSLYVPNTLRQTDVAAVLLERVAAGQGPTGLPTDEQFSVADDDLIGDAYEGSWLAVELLIEELGPAEFLAFYAEASDGPTPSQPRLEEAIEQATGRSYAEFEQSWLAELDSLADR